MKITFVMPRIGTDGGVRVCAVYAQRLAARGHDVHVFSCDAEPVPLKRRARQWLRRQIRRERPAPHRTHFDDLPHLHTKLDKPGPITADDVPHSDVVIATWWETAEWVSRYPASKGTKVHLIQHDERVMYTEPEAQARVGRTWQLPDFSRVTVAEWISRVGRDEFGAESRTIGNAVDREQFDAPARGRADRPTVGMMYSSVAFKGSDMGIEAVRRAKDQVPGLVFSIFSADRRPRELELPEPTQWLCSPSQSELVGYYRSLDAFLFPSRCEGFGLPILEAMACRTPVIGFPTGAAPELIEQGGGRLVPMGDIDAMARAVAEIITGPQQQWDEMSNAAHETAAKADWERATDELERFLLEAVQRR